MPSTQPGPAGHRRCRGGCGLDRAGPADPLFHHRNERQRVAGPSQIDELPEKACSPRDRKERTQGSPRSLDQRNDSEKKLSQHLTETPSCEGPRVGAAVQAATPTGYRSAGKVSTPQPLGEGLHRHQCLGRGSRRLRDVCRVHGCLRGRHGAAAGWVFEGVAFQCAHRGLRAAATKQAEWPGPRPGRDVSRHPKRGCETTAAQHTAQSLQRRRDGITPARRLLGQRRARPATSRASPQRVCAPGRPQRA